MSEPREFVGQLYLIFADREGAGPGLLRLAQIIREEIATACSKHDLKTSHLRREHTA